MALEASSHASSPTSGPDPQSGAAIAVRGVTKLYARTEGRAETLKEGLLRALAHQGRRDVIVALDNVDLDIAPGEALGLIGPNGSGKTTLLKLIAGISQPTSGSIWARGRILGLIELGAGFHPDLTGVENIRLQGAIYGMAADEIENRIPDILDFAELGNFRHLPVKHYSSGMFVRLGFAIAVHTQPDILLVDEVLSVGDQRFQERCLAAIRRMLAHGATLVLVTHFPEQAERVCNRVAWLEGGKLRQVGPAAQVLADYHSDLLARRYAESEGAMSAETFAVGLPGRFGSGEARIEAVRLLGSDGQPRTHFKRGEGLRLEIDYRAQPGIEAVDCTIPLDSLEGTILTLWRAERDATLSHPAPVERTGGGEGAEGENALSRGGFTLDVPAPPLLPGRYRMTISLSPPGRPSDHYDVLYKLFHFSIEPDAAWDTIAPIELKPKLMME